MILKTSNLELRPWRESDAVELYELAKNPNIGPIAGWPPHESVEYSSNIIKTVFSKNETYAIIKDSKLIGSIAILIHPDGNYYWGDGCGEIGYWIGEEYWGHGFAFEASEILLHHAFFDLKLERIYATYHVENNQSRRVLEKLGFKYYDSVNNKGFLEIVMFLDGL